MTDDTGTAGVDMTTKLGQDLLHRFAFTGRIEPTDRGLVDEFPS